MPSAGSVDSKWSNGQDRPEGLSLSLFLSFSLAFWSRFPLGFLSVLSSLSLVSSSVSVCFERLWQRVYVCVWVRVRFISVTAEWDDRF